MKFGALINSSLNIDHVLDSAMKWAEEFMDAEASTVYELDAEKDELFIRLARGEKKDPVKNIRLRVGEGISGSVVQTGKPEMIQDVRSIGLNWKEGLVNNHFFQGKILDLPSKYGINGGRISKLIICDSPKWNKGKKCVYHYDRGLDFDNTNAKDLQVLLEYFK